jgi:hypothetical protein
MLIPMVIAGLALVIFIKEVPLRASLDAEAEAEGEPAALDATAARAAAGRRAGDQGFTGSTNA